MSESRFIALTSVKNGGVGVRFNTDDISGYLETIGGKTIVYFRSDHENPVTVVESTPIVDMLIRQVGGIIAETGDF